MSFKTLNLAEDVASLVSSINEVVAISGSIYSVNDNVKLFKNIASSSADVDLGGYWQSVFDASPTSSLSTGLFDMTYGFATGSVFNLALTATSSLSEKVKIYRHFASTLLGNSNALFSMNSLNQSECFFISLKRNIQKDELKKDSISLTINSESPIQYTASDDGAGSSFKQDVGGDFAPLKAGGTGSEVGQVWYNSGVIVLSPTLAFTTVAVWTGSSGLGDDATNAGEQASGSINGLVDGLRTHIERIDFHNTTNLHSTVFFCRATNTEFNYSSNSSFVDDNKRIRVTSGSNILQTRTYITTVGLYDAQDNLLAVGKINKPIMKSPDTEAIFRIRLDY